MKNKIFPTIKCLLIHKNAIFNYVRCALKCNLLRHRLYSFILWGARNCLTATLMLTIVYINYVCVYRAARIYQYFKYQALLSRDGKLTGFAY